MLVGGKEKSLERHSEVKLTVFGEWLDKEVCWRRAFCAFRLWETRTSTGKDPQRCTRHRRYPDI